MFADSIRLRREALRRALTAGPIVRAPGVFDLVSARIADRIGFDALYMTGYGVNASLLGRPDAGLGTYRDFVDRVRTVSAQTSTALIADADTGFGGALNVAETVRGYEQAGAAAIQIEDQVFPKRCGHTMGREVVPVEDMVLKLRVATDTRDDKNFLLVARTDARTSHGLDAALSRAEAYLNAGADILFIESPETIEELRTIGARFRGAALLANMVPGGRTPMVSAHELEAMGFRVVIYPVTPLLAAAAAMETALRDLGGTTASMLTFSAMNELTGFEEVWAFDKRYGPR